MTLNIKYYINYVNDKTNHQEIEKLIVDLVDFLPFESFKLIVLSNDFPESINDLMSISAVFANESDKILESMIFIYILF